MGLNATQAAERVIINSPEDTITQGPKLILTKTFKQRSDNKIAAVILEKKGEDLWLVLNVMVNFQKKPVKKTPEIFFDTENDFAAIKLCDGSPSLTKKMDSFFQKMPKVRLLKFRRRN